MEFTHVLSLMRRLGMPTRTSCATMLAKAAMSPGCTSPIEPTRNVSRAVSLPG